MIRICEFRMSYFFVCRPIWNF